MQRVGWHAIRPAPFDPRLERRRARRIAEPAFGGGGFLAIAPNTGRGMIPPRPEQPRLTFVRPYVVYNRRPFCAAVNADLIARLSEESARIFTPFRRPT
jgi:hypothetical protein